MKGVRKEKREGGGKRNHKRDGDKSREKQDVRTEIQKNRKEAAKQETNTPSQE